MTKIASKGTKLQLSIASVYTDIAQIESLDAPDAEVQVVDVTALDSGVGMEFKPNGYVNGGASSGSLFYDPVLAVHQALTDLITTPAVAAWKYIFADAAATVWPFNGTLTKCQPKASVQEFVKADFNIKLDGMVTYPT